MDPLHVVDVFKGIGIEQHEIGGLAYFYGSNMVQDAEVFRGAGSRGAQNIQVGETRGGEKPHLSRQRDSGNHERHGRVRPDQWLAAGVMVHLQEPPIQREPRLEVAQCVWVLASAVAFVPSKDLPDL